MDNAQIMPDTSVLSGENSLGVVSMMSTDSGGYVDQAPSIVQNDSGSQSHASFVPLSPQRSNHTHNSVPSSPASNVLSTPLQMSPVRVPHPTPSSSGRPGQPDVSMSNFAVPSLEYSNNMLLGVQQLERQQAEMEQRRRFTPARNPQSSNPSQNSGSYDDGDEHTEPSSTVTGSTRENPAGGFDLSDRDPATSTFGRLIQNTRRRLSSGDRNRTSSADEDEMLNGAVIYGYLQKLGRNGKWQSRWFETDGECLTYYKSQKRIKLLATLDLAKVGSIVINHDDPKGVSFTINISERPYLLRAESKAICKDWVITLNRVKEARMNDGNIKITKATSGHTYPMEFPDHDIDKKPRVVVVANRPRGRRAVDEEELMQSMETEVVWEDPAAPSTQRYSPRYGDVAPPSSSRLARWQKPKTSITRIAGKLLRWARSLRKFSCADTQNDVVLDHHVHPPGHDDKPKRLATAPSPVGSGISGRSKLSASERAGPSVSVQEFHADSIAQSSSAATSHGHDEEEEELETRELS